MRQFRGHVHVDLHRYIDMYKLYLCLCLCSSSSQPKLYKLHNLPSSSGPKIHVDLMSMSMFKSTYTYQYIKYINIFIHIYVIVPSPPKLYKNIYI